MDNRQDLTINTYQENFDKYVARTPSESSGEFKVWMDSFLSYLPKNGSIFELGSASGRDARYFSSKGFKIFCTDIIPQALDKLSQEGFKTSEFDFRENPKEEWLGKFDGVFANAVLLHATPEIFEKTLQNVIKLLKTNGIIAFSLKTGEGEEISHEKMDAPRYFKYYSEEELRTILSKLPIEILNFSPADEGKWFHVILKVK